MTLTATYRVQLHAGFRFRDAERIVPYLRDLGVSHVYTSPYLAAEAGSTHGYDLVDPCALNAEIGDLADYLAFTDALAASGMSHVVDVVPNHMSASTANAWWAEVLENGPSSIHAATFDVEWHPPKIALDDKVLLPVLGAQYGEVLERGELKLERRGGAFRVRYFDRCLPVNPSSTLELLERAATRLPFPAEDPRREELESIVTGVRNLPSSRTTEPALQRERHREKEVLKRRLEVLCEDASVGAAIDGVLAEVNGTAGDPASFDALDRLLVDQSYRLAYWRVATEEINCRRFFDINELAAVRMERPEVFEASMALLLRLVSEGRVGGIRLDHTDGLHDPRGFFEELRRRVGGELWVIVEKILSAGEELPASWPVDGTTGYDFLAQASGLFVDPRAEGTMTRLWVDLSGDARTFGAHVADAKRAIMRASLSSEVHMLSIRLERIAMRDRRSRDFTYAALRRAITETIVAFPVYRTYVRPDGTCEPEAPRILERAVRLARRRNPEVSPSVFDFLRDVLLLREAPDREARVELAMRFQQLTGPVMAKGVEDTAFYTYLRFAALNEVGGAPDRFGTSPAAFHAANAGRAERWPRTMTALSTHDTKRGADVRARLAVLSEMPETWDGWARRWLEATARFGAEVDEERAPSDPDRYLVLQTIVGALPFGEIDVPDFAARISAYAVKAAREAKQRTSWLSPNEAYESALRGWAAAVLGDAETFAGLALRVRDIARHGASNGLALAVLAAASPGIPDTFQGSEVWDLRLVDPDNRAPVDHARLARLAAQARDADPAALLAAYESGAVKLRVLASCLRARRTRPELFTRGAYVPLEAPEEVLAFARRHGGDEALCIVTRLPLRATRGGAPWAVGDVWGEAALAVPAGRFREAITGRDVLARDGSLALRDALAVLPVALLLRA